MKSTLLLACLAAAPAFAMLRQGSAVTVSADEVIGEDLYVTGGTVSVLGTIHGDLVVFAGTVDVSGQVDGDVISAGGTVTITGQVGGSIRAAAGQLTLKGPVANDVLLAGGSANLLAGTSIGRDLIVAAGSVELAGPVARNVVANAGQLTINDRIGGTFTGEIGQLVLGRRAVVEGDLSYVSQSNLRRAPGSVTAGRVEHAVRAASTERGVAFVVGWLRALVGLFLFSVIWLTIFPGFSRRAADTLQASPLKTLGAGAVALIGIPVIASIAFVVGALIGGWWMGLIVLGVLGVAAAVSAPLVGQVIGNLIFGAARLRNRPRWAAELLGLIVILLLAAIPFLGPLVALTVLLLGLGGQVLALPGRVRVRTPGRLDMLPESWPPPPPVRPAVP